jgi:hypothetical protein
MSTTRTMQGLARAGPGVVFLASVWEARQPRVGREGEGKGVRGETIGGNPGGCGEGCPRGVPPPGSESAEGRPY